MRVVPRPPRYCKRPAGAPLAFLLFGLAAGSAAGPAQLPLARFEVPVPAASELEPLLARVLDATRAGERISPDDAEDDEAALRRLQQRATDALATEGYFGAHMTVASDPQKQARYRIAVDAGAR